MNAPVKVVVVLVLLLLLMMVVLLLVVMVLLLLVHVRRRSGGGGRVVRGVSAVVRLVAVVAAVEQPRLVVRGVGGRVVDVRDAGVRGARGQRTWGRDIERL